MLLQRIVQGMGVGGIANLGPAFEQIMLLDIRVNVVAGVLRGVFQHRAVLVEELQAVNAPEKATVLRINRQHRVVLPRIGNLMCASLQLCIDALLAQQ